MNSQLIVARFRLFRSLIELAKLHGYKVDDTTPLSVLEALESDEMFTSGTAVVVAPVGSITYQVRLRTHPGHGPRLLTAFPLKRRSTICLMP